MYLEYGNRKVFRRVSFALPWLLSLLLSACGAGGNSTPAAQATVPSTAESTVSSGAASTTNLATGTYLAGSTLYPRVIRIEHSTSGADGDLIASTNGQIYISTNNSKTFSYLDTVPQISGSTEYCCADLFEMPQTVGSLTAGTLLFAATYYVGATRAIEVYSSTDNGKSWSYSSTPVSGGDSAHGLWEPEFSVADDGALVMFWSDETDTCCSQKIAQIRTFDGTSWQDQTNTVASSIYADRPGMAVVTKLPNGTYFMSYELCGPAACTVFYRTSQDGWNYGNPSNTGTKISTVSGQYFEHAPTNAWSPSVVSGNGALILVGQVLYNANGAVSSQNGKVLFMNTSPDGAGPWYAISAPVQVPTAYDNYCPNYSSALLPSPHGNSILELASDYNSQDQCVTYFSSENWNEQPISGTTYDLVNSQAGLCLDDAADATQNGTPADLATCSGLSGQKWVVHSSVGGYFTIQNVYSSLCLDNTGASAAGGTKVTLSSCDSSMEQNWQFLDLGNASYTLLGDESGGLALDDTGGSVTSGTQLQMSADDGLPRQQWALK